MNGVLVLEFVDGTIGRPSRPPRARRRGCGRRRCGGRSAWCPLRCRRRGGRRPARTPGPPPAAPAPSRPAGGPRDGGAHPTTHPSSSIKPVRGVQDRLTTRRGTQARWVRGVSSVREISHPYAFAPLCLRVPSSMRLPRIWWTWARPPRRDCWGRRKTPAKSRPGRGTPPSRGPRPRSSGRCRRRQGRPPRWGASPGPAAPQALPPPTPSPASSTSGPGGADVEGENPKSLPRPKGHPEPHQKEALHFTCLEL